MKTYINQNCEKMCFVGKVPEGWREMTDEELQQKAQKELEEKQNQTDLEELKQKKLEELVLADITTPQKIKDFINRKKVK